jgi:hypothetical protein
MTFFKVTLACLLAIGIYNFADTVVDLYIKGGVYACSDKEDNPTHIQQQCKRLTKGQWWSK